MPHKLFDYMREAKPVIAPDFSIEVARIVDEAACGVLVEVTERLRKVLRTEDTLARLGGDEFVVLMENLSTMESFIR